MLDIKNLEKVVGNLKEGIVEYEKDVLQNIIDNCRNEIANATSEDIENNKHYYKLCSEAYGYALVKLK